MAVKKNLEVVPSLPTTEHDLEDLLSARLADELVNDIDIGKLAKLTVSKMGIKLKQQFVNWLLSDNSPQVALNEIEASADEVAA
jgi:hypothetical protein